uniref:Uncharacterized protein n=1 Tax=Brassica oleracea TaxID=3712 RepID=A0A3P6B835_BRAOL|nr:unnamed protein product [Brassica oleracea]
MIVMFWSRILIVRLVLLSTALRFANFILFFIPSLFSYLVAVWIVFSSVYARWAWKVVYVSSLSSGFSVVGFHSRSLRLVLWFFVGMSVLL